MKKKIISLLLITAMLLSIFPMTVFAGTKPFQGVEIDYGGAVLVNIFTFETDGFITFQYKSSSSLEIPEGYRAVADILVVGGGGSGSSGGKNSSKQGYGGTGGEVVIQKNAELAAGKYIVAVGGGGEPVIGNKSNSRTSGKNGYDSYVEGPNDFSITAKKGSGGGASTVSGTGTVSDITGTSVTYGADGESKTSSGDASVSGEANTGNGGSGGYQGAKSGAGGSGVVIIRITEIVPLHAPEIAYTIVIPTEISVNKKGVTAIGKPTVKDVENADGKIITYTAEGTDFIKSDDGDITVMAEYYTAYTDADNNTPLGTESITVYDGGYISEEALTALYVFISDEEWENAENGTYHATVTYNFEAKEIVTIASLLPEDFPSSDGFTPENAWASQEQDTDYHIYRCGDNLQGDGFSLPLTTVLTPTERGYTCQTSSTAPPNKKFVSDYTFILTGSVLTAVEQVVKRYQGATLNSTSTYTFVAQTQK